MALKRINNNEEIQIMEKINRSYSILYVTPETMPFASSGGLGEVAGSLPKTLNKNKNAEIDCRVIMPLYSGISNEYREKMEFIGSCQLPPLLHEQYVGIYQLRKDETIYYFIDNEYYFKRDSLYGFFDDFERFSYFSRAVFAAMDMVDFHPDIIHCNDWQTALVSIYQNSLMRKNYTKTVFTIHNIEYQGNFDMDSYDSCIFMGREDSYIIEYRDRINLMKGGIESCNICNTVSPSYAKELNHPAHSFGLEEIINRNQWKIKGILNGIDVSVYNPETDNFISHNYSSKDLTGKGKCKIALQKELGLPVRDVPMITLVSRLVPAKGMDLIVHSMENIIRENDVQFVMLGTGFFEYENFFISLNNNYPEKVRSMLEFSVEKSHKIYAGGDILLMPSRSEPCGLSQMIGCRYGDIPVVRETGGLKDSIKDCTLGEGNGFTFAEYGTEGFTIAVLNSLNTYKDKVHWEKLVTHDIGLDFSWKKASEEYDNEQDIPITINVGSTVIPGPTVHFEGVPDKEPKTFDKGSWKWQDRKFSYSVNINQKKQVIKNVVITDEQQNKGVTIDKDSFRIYKGKWYKKNHSWKLDETAANLVTSQFIDKVVWKYNEDGKIIGFTLPIGDIGADDGYMIRYDSDVSYLPVNGECFFNDATMTGDEIEHLKVHSGLNYAIGGGIAEGYVFTIKVVKKDDSTPAKPVKGAKFKFVRDSNGADLGVHETDDNGEIQLKNLLRDTYTITEVSVPNGYVLDKTPKKVNPADFGEDKIALASVTNKKIPVIDISGEKTWSDGDNQDGKRPSSITVNLLADGKEIKEQTVTPDSDGKWKYSFKGLPECDKDGKKIVYTVTEDSVDEYNAEIDGYNIKNSYTPKKTSVTATKRWNDNNNQDGKRPNSVKVQLYGDGNKVGAEVELNKGNNWTTTWNDLPEKKAGKTIVYTVEEVGTVEGYTSTVNNQNIGNIIICNKHTPEKTEVAGEKTWKDANNQDGKRPESITVNLLADGKKVAEKTVTKDDAWKYEFKDLPKYKDGKEIVYTVTENTVVGYSTGIKGHDITNSYTPGETSVTVTKHWNDSNDKDGIRPGSIKVQLFGDGNKVGDEVELNEKNNWTTTWNKLPQKKSGKDITYTVKEVGSLSGYTTTVDDKNHGDIIITNTHTPKEISGVKTGDNTNLMLFIFLMFTSSAVLGTILVRRKRKIQ